MAGKLPSYVAELFTYLTSPPHEAAHQHRAHAYFQHVFGDTFHVDEGQSDGYVAGRFVVELKGASSDWHAGLIQGIAYHKRLDFSAVVVVAHEFLAMWRLDDLPRAFIEKVEGETGSPHEIGQRLAAWYRKNAKDLISAHLKAALWRCPVEIFAPLLSGGTEQITDAFSAFETHLKKQKRTRLRITPKNFTHVLHGMVPFFQSPMHAVHAFYSAVFAWNEGARVILSEQYNDQASLGGEMIGHLLPHKRDNFKEYAERYAIHLEFQESVDDFFAHYDDALDEADPEFRRRHGIFFTDLDLSKFVMWDSRRLLGDIGRNHLVIDPACGSGNLVTNWKSPMELRHKVVSDIEKELLFAVERRMKGDAWHNGRFTVVPKVTADSGGLNFLDVDAKTYLRSIRKCLREKGLDTNRPIAFLCNPPFRNDDDQAIASGAGYDIDESIVSLIGPDAARERYCCFLAQMKLVCDAAEDAGLPGDSYLLVFTKLGWLSDRDVLAQVKGRLMGHFDAVGGIIVNGQEFFKVKGRFPVAFSVWRYRPNGGADTNRPVNLTDLTWITKEMLASIRWQDGIARDAACTALRADPRAVEVAYGARRQSIKDWCGVTRLNLYRIRRRDEIGDINTAGGLPRGSERRSDKQTYGENNGASVGFMDNLEPFRVRNPRVRSDVPWFRLDKPFMDYRRARCLSGPPDQKGYCPDPQSPEASDRVFFWYAIQKTFAEEGLRYPMWADPLDLWAPPHAQQPLRAELRRLSRAIAFADNECIEIKFPADNPVIGAPEVWVANPMTPNDPGSYWSKHCASLFTGRQSPPTVADRLVDAVNKLYTQWRSQFRMQADRSLDRRRAYYLTDQTVVTASSGLLQIKDYFDWKDDSTLRAAHQLAQRVLKEAKVEFHRILFATDGLDYFGQGALAATQPMPPPPQEPGLADTKIVTKKAKRATT